jgi:hypothetical protein
MRSHLSVMNKIIAVSLIFLTTVSCRYQETVDQSTITDSKPSSKDTGTVAILRIDTTNFLFSDVTSDTLTSKELINVNTLLASCIENHNSKQDTIKTLKQYLDIKKYKLQLVPFISKDGSKKVYINCFCSSYSDFDYWRQELVDVDDGGGCFFHLIINLTDNRCEDLVINGY